MLSHFRFEDRLVSTHCSEIHLLLAYSAHLLCRVRYLLKKRERGKSEGQEGPWENWEKVQVLWICRGVGVVLSKVIRD